MSSNEFTSKYEQFFSNRLFSSLPSSAEGTIISNIDYVICDYKTKKFFLLELKTRGNQMQQRQKGLYNMLHKRLLRTNKGVDDWTFVGTYCVSFAWTNFYDGPVTIQGTGIIKKTIDEETLKCTLYSLLN